MDCNASPHLTIFVGAQPNPETVGVHVRTDQLRLLGGFPDRLRIRTVLRAGQLARLWIALWILHAVQPWIELQTGRGIREAAHPWAGQWIDL